MTTPISVASAQIFLNILKLTFMSRHSDSNWFLPATDLSTILPNRIEQYLQKNGNNTIYGQTIKTIHLNENICRAISSNTQSWTADHIILAIPPWQISALIQPHRQLNSLYSSLNNFSYEPITTIYFEFPTAVNLTAPMIGMLNSNCQWIFDRKISSQPNILSAVISGPNELQSLSKLEVATVIAKEITNLFPYLPPPIKHQVIREKRGAFSCTVAIQNHRPSPRTKIENLWLAGDYIQTGLPATLEGALLSGRNTANLILERV
jgi:protoporphyrinogen oxidase